MLFKTHKCYITYNRWKSIFGFTSSMFSHVAEGQYNLFSWFELLLRSCSAVPQRTLNSLCT